jgi:hypothetical protein
VQHPVPPQRLAVFLDPHARGVGAAYCIDAKGSLLINLYMS